MRRKSFISFLIFLLVISFSSASDACRFWVASGKNMPEDVIKSQLIELPHSLKKLGKEYADGWSVAFFQGTTALVARSEKASTDDERFNKVVGNASDIEPKIVIGHLRRASSGCKEGVANPHPFQRFHGGDNWLFGHNGGIDKDVLVNLITQEYLDAHPPRVCNDDPPTSWVDSELYFIYLLKKIDEADENVLKGLQSAVEELSSHIKEDEQYLNFFLANGKRVWAYRKGTSLFYTYDRKNRLSIISSTIPGEDQFEWKEFPEGQFALLRPTRKPKFYK